MDNGQADEEFDIIQWLTDDVKLPQYCEIFVEHGFESPTECCYIDDNVLNSLGIEKLGHRKRILTSSKRLGRKYGVVTDEQPEIIRSENETSDNLLAMVSEESGETNTPPALPPKRTIGKKPEPPKRQASVDVVKSEEEVISNDDKLHCTSEKPNSDANLNDEKILSPSMAGEKSIDSTNVAIITEDQTDVCETSSPGLPPSIPKLGYEPLWEAVEGKPLPLSPIDVSNDEIPEQSNDIGSQQVGISSTDHNINEQVPNTPPPIPPRADLEDVPDTVQDTVPSNGTQSLGESDVKETIPIRNNNIPVCAPSEEVFNEIVTTDAKSEIHMEPRPGLKSEMAVGEKPKKQAPKKPPRHKANSTSKTVNKDKHNVDNDYHDDVDHIETDQVANMNDTTLLPEKQQSSVVIDASVEKTNDENELDNIYGNAEIHPPVKSQPPPTVVLPRKPMPAPRIRTVSQKSTGKESSQNEIPPELPAKPAPKLPERSSGEKKEVLSPSAFPETESGSCTEDDLSGSDTEMSDEKLTIKSVYETVITAPTRISVLQPRHMHKDGYLFKQGGQQNNKGWKKRWVVFDGKELRYYKDKEHMNESLQVVPCTIMKEVRIVTEDTKRSRFDLTCAGRTYMFALGIDEMDAIQVWAQILMGAILVYRKENSDVMSIPGGVMSDPDKQGFLKKQGNNVVVDYKKRYIVIKEDNFAYYHNREDFIHASPINTLQMSLANVKVDPKSNLRFLIVTPHRTYVFQCDDENELRSWVSAIETAIQFALSDTTVVNKIWENPSNRFCADCGKKGPVWASVNLAVCVCENCIGVHRNLGVQTSKPRSLLMDQKIWKPSLIKLLVEVGNETSNKFWIHMCPEDDLIYPDSSPEARSDFIFNKYAEKRYRHVSALYGDPVELGEALRKSVVTNDIEATMKLVFCGADVTYVPADGSDNRTPFELATDAKQELQMEFLQQNGGNIEKETSSSPVKTNAPLSLSSDNVYEAVEASTAPTSSEKISYEKEGYLQKKAPSAAVWKRRYFTLKGRELGYEKGEKELLGVIKLKDVTEYIYNNTTTLDIVTNDRTYNLRADTKEEALSWYTTLRNKQVFGVALELQGLGSDGVPHVVAKCLQFVETFGLDNEGIYRKNGNKAKIKTLKKLLDQDVEAVLITREEYEPEDIAGLLKEYFRELPDPLMTEDAYPHFITASLNHDHMKKMYLYKDGLVRLPDVNRNTLKCVISHLVRVVAHSAQNLMKLENVSLIFGPTLMSNQQMGAMDTQTINQEFAVIADFITNENYAWLFDVDEKEMEKDKKIELAMKKMMELSQVQSSQASSVTELTLDVHSISRKQESSRITVYSKSKASQVCREIVAKRGMAPDGNWALFHVVDGEIERPFPATEKVLDTILRMSKYTQFVKGSYLVVKENFIAQKMQLYGFLDDSSASSLVAANTLQTMRETKKREKWGKLHVKLEKGVISVYKTAKAKDELDTWRLDETDIFFGVDRDKKPVTGFGFTIARIKNDQCHYRYFCFDDERELYRWITVFLKLKYPSTSLWVDKDLEAVGCYQEIRPVSMLVTVKKKPPPRPMQGVSSNVVNELRAKQKSLGK